MAFQIIVHLLISVMWMFLSETYTLNSFLIGFLIGALLLTILRRFIPGKLYLLRVYSIIKLIIIFLRELILSNIEIVKLVYQKRSEEHTSELQSRGHLVCRLLLENKKRASFDTRGKSYYK